MALQVLEFEFKSAATQEIAKEWSHLGVTGSGDLEVLMEKKALNGGVKAKVVTPVKGFDAVWEKMLQRKTVPIRVFQRYRHPRRWKMDRKQPV